MSRLTLNVSVLALLLTAGCIVDDSLGDPDPDAGAGSSGVGLTDNPASTGPSTSDVDSEGSVTPQEQPVGWIVEGQYLFALEPSIAATTPLQFVGTVFADGALLDISLTPLSLEFGSTTKPRKLIEKTFVFESIPIAADGTFVLDFEAAAIPGAANPITGSDIVAEFRIDGWFVGPRICGKVSGMVTVPANIGLHGSSFGGIPLDGEDLPPIEDASCPFEEPESSV